MASSPPPYRTAVGPLKSNKVCDVTLAPGRPSSCFGRRHVDRGQVGKYRQVGLRTPIPRSHTGGADDALAKHRESPALASRRTTGGVRRCTGSQEHRGLPSPGSSTTPLRSRCRYSRQRRLMTIWSRGVGEIIGKEARAFGNHDHSGVDFWTPNINPFRDPRWGRGSETPGEDIARVKGYTARFLRGLEETAPSGRSSPPASTTPAMTSRRGEASPGTRSTPRSRPRTWLSTICSPSRYARETPTSGPSCVRTTASTGCPPAQVIICSRPCSGSIGTGRQATTTSRATARRWLMYRPPITTRPATRPARRPGFNAGMDSSCEYSSSSDIPGAWKSKALNETTVNRALVRLYEGLVRAGYFDGASAKHASLGASDLNTPQAQQLALQAAVDGTVMLKNDGTLPIKPPAGAKLAMIGFWADDTSKLRGGYSGPPPYLHTPAYAAQKLGYQVTTAQGPITGRGQRCGQVVECGRVRGKQGRLHPLLRRTGHLSRGGGERSNVDRLAGSATVPAEQACGPQEAAGGSTDGRSGRQHTAAREFGGELDSLGELARAGRRNRRYATHQRSQGPGRPPPRHPVSG